MSSLSATTGFDSSRLSDGPGVGATGTLTMTDDDVGVGVESMVMTGMAPGVDVAGAVVVDDDSIVMTVKPGVDVIIGWGDVTVATGCHDDGT